VRKSGYICLVVGACMALGWLIYSTRSMDKPIVKERVDIVKKATTEPRPKVVHLHRVNVPVYDLTGLVILSDVMVTGTVTGIVRTAPTPLDGKDDGVWLGNHTLYTVRVDRRHKGNDIPDEIKVKEEGGFSDGILHEIPDSLPLEVNKSYLFSLRQSGSLPISKKAGMIPVQVNGKTYNAGGLDELKIIDPYWGKIDLSNGSARPSTPPGREWSIPSAEFRIANEVIGKSPEELALAIQAILAQMEAARLNVISQRGPLLR